MNTVYQTITKKILKAITWPIVSLMSNPKIRYSIYFSIIHNSFSYSTREEMLKIAMEFAEWSRLEGDYLEFGVWRGRNLAWAYHFARKSHLDKMRFYAFDSFSGLPEPQDEDADFKQFQKGDFYCDIDTFKKNISKKGVDLNTVTIVPGWYDKTLTEETKRKIPLKKAAIVWIDCDLYESTVPVLNFITDYLEDGTILIFDDYFCFRGNPNKGEQKAFGEWLSKNPKIKVSEYHKFDWGGNSFIIHKN